MRDSLNRMKKRQTPSKPMTHEERGAIAEACNIIYQIESQNAAKMMYMMYLMQSARAKPLNMEEIKEAFTKHFNELIKAARSENTGLGETFEAIGQLFKNYVPDIGPTDDIIRELNAAEDKRRKNDREAYISLAELFMENRRRKNPQLVMMEIQHKLVLDNIWKNSLKP